ncbi:hypothetical protein [Streptomyces spiramyceticus]|uniref:hypothetical protein n=1 Tax=Streptomyces spiramyceticus TaxID=299717 RepID=UPI00237BF2C6|nr:hypothetical protein [Streptomyces spiramyceticus]
MFGKLPAVFPFDRTQQPMHIRAHPPPQIGPAEPVTNPQQHLFQLARPHIRLHIILHDQYNSDHPTPVTNNHHMTARQLNTLRKTPLTSGNSKLQLEY